MAKSLDIYIDQGADLMANLPPVTDPTGAVLDLTGYTATSQLRRGYASRDAIAFIAAISNPTGGIITLTLGNETTAGLAPLRYVYDVMIADNNGVLTKVFDGLCIVNPGVTGKPITNVILPTIPDDWGGNA